MDSKILTILHLISCPKLSCVLCYCHYVKLITYRYNFTNTIILLCRLGHSDWYYFICWRHIRRSRRQDEQWDG